MKKQFKTGRDVDEWLALQDITRKELAAEIGYSYSRVSHICSEKDKPLSPKFAKAVEAFKSELMESNDYRYSNDNFMQQIYDVLEEREDEMKSLKNAIARAKKSVEYMFNAPIDFQNIKLRKLIDYYEYVASILCSICWLMEVLDDKDCSEDRMRGITDSILKDTIAYSKKR